MPETNHKPNEKELELAALKQLALTLDCYGPANDLSTIAYPAVKELTAKDKLRQGILMGGADEAQLEKYIAQLEELGTDLHDAFKLASAFQHETVMKLLGSYKPTLRSKGKIKSGRSS